MKNKILHKEFLDSSNWFVEIELIPENEFEANAIENIRLGQSTEEEYNLVETSLLEALRGMSIVNLIRQQGNIFALTVKG